MLIDTTCLLNNYDTNLIIAKVLKKLELELKFNTFKNEYY